MIGLHDLSRCFSPEIAHNLAIFCLKNKLINLPARCNLPRLRSNIFGADFASPIGIAAGFDKNAECAGALLNSGLGFAEFGTVTPKPQAGNTKPRVFRIAKDSALINKLGFNNSGSEIFLHNIRKIKHSLAPHAPYGINIGRNAVACGVDDYTNLFKMFYDMCNYIVINISSPNTIGLRDMQFGSALDELLHAIECARQQCIPHAGHGTPCLIKISPDIDDNIISDIVTKVTKYKIDGLVLTNTTKVDGGGGMSGKPLLELSNDILRRFRIATKGTVPLIGVGGVMSAEDAYRKIRLGASLVQLYTGIVYSGFGIIDSLNYGLDKLLARDGFNSVTEAIGIDVPNI